jgi:hypothetical protein
MEMGGQLHTPTALPQGKEPPVSIGYEAVWAPELVWTLWKREKSCTAGNQTRAAQPVARRYTDCAIPTPCYISEDRIYHLLECSKYK